MIWLEETLISYLSVQTSRQLISFLTRLQCGQVLQAPNGATLGKKNATSNPQEHFINVKNNFFM